MIQTLLPSYAGLLSTIHGLIEHNRYPHAIMLNSTDGLPAMYVAQEVAKTLLCQSNDRPCLTCNSCKLVQSMTHPDLLYSFPYISSGKTGNCDDFISEWRSFNLDNSAFLYEDWQAYLEPGNKQLGIFTGETQRIAHFQSLKPYLSSSKVVIMYMSEALNPSASNKLLKFIEEPLENTYIILITNQLESNIKTITSRCQSIKIPVSGPEHFNSEVKTLGLPLDNLILKIAPNNVGLYSHLVKKKEDMISYGNQFLEWLRHCFTGHLFGISEDTEAITRLPRERLTIMLEAFINIFRDAFVFDGKVDLYTQLTPVEKLAPFINENNAVDIYNTLQKLMNDLNRNGNTKLLFFDTSLKLNQMLRSPPS